MKLLPGVVVAIALLDAGPARACTSDGSAPSAKQVAAMAPDVFTWFEQAAVVVEVEVTAAPGFTNEGHGLRGDVVLTVTKTWKGKPAPTITVVQEMTPCGGESKGNKYLAFFDAKSHRLGATATSTAPALAAWQAAHAPADQQQLLAKLAASPDPLIAGAAAKRIAVTSAWNEPAKNWKQPGTSALAIARVGAQWSAILAAVPAGRLRDFDEAIAQKRCVLAAARDRCATAKQHIIDVASPTALGEVGALASGECWAVTCAVGFYTLHVYVGAADGRVLVIWIPPEG